MIGLSSGGVVWVGVAVFLLFIAAEYKTAFIEWAVGGYWCGRRDANKVALTFDDGPGEYTPFILDLLAAHEAKATFFVTGENVEQHANVVRRIVAEGHALGNHGYRDEAPPLIGPDPHQTADGIVSTQDIVEETAGVRPTLFRLPRGRPRRDIWRAVREEGMVVVHASVASLSERTQSPQSLSRVIVRRARKGDIIILHDGWSGQVGSSGPPCLSALPPIIAGLREKGLELVTVPELLDLPK